MFCTVKKNLETVFLFYFFLTIVMREYSKNNSLTEGSKLRLLTSQFGLDQIINEPPDIKKNSSTCIDLLFTSQNQLSN